MIRQMIRLTVLGRRNVICTSVKWLKPVTRFSPTMLAHRCIHNTNIPFRDDLDAPDDELFNLEDFQHYQESPDVISKKQQQLNDFAQPESLVHLNPTSLQEVVAGKIPTVFVSKLNSPYLNLAIEDFVYNKMPISDTNTESYDRLMFYVNSPCVVIGKNQNPWKEANVALLNSLHIPLLRRKSGGGTVVHDTGNVNFSFMTTKANFDRFKFVELICQAVNDSGLARYQIEVNPRGDIVTHTQPDNINYKVSGSAYKLSKGKSYHHGTMLLNLRLDILKQLLSTTEEKNGQVKSTASVESVKAKVANIEMDTEKFIQVVTEAFRHNYGQQVEMPESEKDHNDMFGLSDFVESNLKLVNIFTIDEQTELPQEIIDTSDQLRLWEWTYGGGPKFIHEFKNQTHGLNIQFIVGKNAVLEDFELTVDPSNTHLIRSFEFLRHMVDQNPSKSLPDKLKYKGSDIAGFITNDEISDWVGECIDGTV